MLTVVGDARLDADDPNDWYLFATGEVVKPLVYQMRQEAKPSLERVGLSKTWVLAPIIGAMGAMVSLILRSRLSNCRKFPGGGPIAPFNLPFTELT